ncbi:MAG: acetolactate synthase large subunit [Rhodospirillales bacterium]
MNGAEALVRTLLAGGVDTCFANPGTSEMHFVAALDRFPAMRCVLGLFEGVVTGAADGYARMADRPAATLLHLGPGLANGLANLHNARRAMMPMVNIVGDHATYHRVHDAPLASDVIGVATPFSHWVRMGESADTISADGAAAIAAALDPPGRIATLVLPADTAWTDPKDPTIHAVPTVAARPRVDAAKIEDAVRRIRAGGSSVGLMLNGAAMRAGPLALAGRIRAATGCRIFAPTSNGRTERGAGRFAVERVPYVVDMALETLKDVRTLILVGARAPVACFAYPGKPSVVTPPDCEIVPLADLHEDLTGTLEALVDALGAGRTAPTLQSFAPPPMPGAYDPITPEGLAAAVAALLPEGAIVVDEGITGGRRFMPGTVAARPHDWLNLTGGAIGDGLPMAVGAAIARPDRPVVVLQADGSAMYTNQGLWTMAREGLNVTVVLLNNRSYATLVGELANVGAKNAGPTALGMFSLDRPAIDWCQMARSMGVEAVRPETMGDFARAFTEGTSGKGPLLIDVPI